MTIKAPADNSEKIKPHHQIPPHNVYSKNPEKITPFENNKIITHKKITKFSPVNQLKKITSSNPPTINTPVTPLNTQAQTENPSIIINDSLGLIPEIMRHQKEPQKHFEIFDPVLQSNINQIHGNKTLRQEYNSPRLELDVDDINTEFTGYRETILNGDCWLIPEDTSFDELDSKIVMRNTNCDNPEKQLENLINKLK